MKLESFMGDYFLSCLNHQLILVRYLVTGSYDCIFGIKYASISANHYDTCFQTMSSGSLPLRQVQMPDVVTVLASYFSFLYQSVIIQSLIHLPLTSIPPPDPLLLLYVDIIQ